MNKFIVITSIFEPTEAVKKFAEFSDWNLIIVGDKKTPENWQYNNVQYISPNNQVSNKQGLGNVLPWNSYTRKNVGYEVAISQGADIIYDTDDDNIPLDNWIQNPSFSGNFEVIHDASYINIYSFFTDKHVWPRGFPLPLLLNPQNFKISKASQEIGVWQHLADEDPDVDAIYRLVDNTPIYFSKRDPLVLAQNAICPFNSQNTYFRKETFPLLYLPSTVTFRYTDILRGLVAQPILWAANFSLGFGESTVVQKRNPHNYLKDFESEIPVYLLAEKIVPLANQVVSPQNSITENLMLVYKMLENEGIVQSQELTNLEVWLKNF